MDAVTVLCYMLELCWLAVPNSKLAHTPKNALARPGAFAVACVVGDGHCRNASIL